MSKTRSLTAFLAFCITLALLVGLESGCATSKPFAKGVVTGVPKMVNDLEHIAGNDPLRRADVNALKEATADEGAIDAVVVERAWNSVKTWYLPEIEKMTDPDARALRQSVADRLDRLIATERGRPLRTP